jgi:hypothetical protein
MSTSQAPEAEPALQTPYQGLVDMEKLSRETGVPVEMLQTFAGISDPRNKHLFTAQAARKAFAGIKVHSGDR